MSTGRTVPKDMSDSERFRKYSQYTFETSGHKKLGFIVNAIEREFGHAKCDVLDIGSGIGSVSFVVASYGHNVTGIEMSSSCIEYANSRKEDLELSNVTFSLRNAEDPVSHTGLYDVAICSEVLEHSYRPDIILSNVSKSLRDEGLAIITIPNGFGPFELTGRFLRTLTATVKKTGIAKEIASDLSLNKGKEQSVNVDVGSGHVQFFSWCRICRLFEMSGLQIISVGSSDFISGVMPLSFAIRKSKTLCRMDFKLADLLPKAFASGWYFVLKKKGVGEESQERVV